MVDTVALSDLKAIISQLKAGETVTPVDVDKLDAAVDTLAVVTNELEQKRASIARLRKMLFGDTTEKLSNVFPQSPNEQESTKDAPSSENESEKDKKSSNDKDGEEKKKTKGHGRTPAKNYTGAQKQTHKHESLVHKGPCPEDGCDGKLYLQNEPKRLIRVTGVAPVSAMVHELERLRCNLCGKIFTAKAPEEVGDETYDNKARAMIALLKYGCGMPFYRLERLEKDLGVPMPTSTQWDEVHKLAMAIAPAYTELIRQAANGKVLHNDDTTAKILKLEPSKKVGKNGKERTGIYTSGILSTGNGHEIALFFTGQNHAGENLERVLAHRSEELLAPIQMCDGIAANTTGNFESVLANCNAHARRKYVEVADNYPTETKHILDIYKEVYKHDKATKGMSDDERLAYHVSHSKTLLDDLKMWFNEQIEVEKNIEPNSGLGAAIAYMQERWDQLTLFLKVPGAPLDNNACERIIKKAILHRKNALFFKTENGALVADMFMSHIHTCELEGVNPFVYLVALAENQDAVNESPENWLPWNYQLNLNN